MEASKLKFPLHRPPLTPWWRRIIHIILLIIGWIIYLLFLNHLRMYPHATTTFILMLFGCFAIAIPTITIIWILHSIALFKKKGPRKNIPTATAQYDTDWNGKKIFANWDKAKHAKKITVTIDKKGKHYLIG